MLGAAQVDVEAQQLGFDDRRLIHHAGDRQPCRLVAENTICVFEMNSQNRVRRQRYGAPFRQILQHRRSLGAQMKRHR